MMAAAQAVRAAGGGLLRGGAYKPRTSPYGFQGLGEKGLELLVEAGAAGGLPVITQVLEPALVDLISSYADVLQIGSRTMANAPLLRAVGRPGGQRCSSSVLYLRLYVRCSSGEHPPNLRLHVRYSSGCRAVLKAGTRRGGCGHLMRTPHGGPLVEKRAVTLILRLVLDANGRLQYGEAVDTEARSQGRFVGWRGLTRTVRAWLARQERAGGEG
jgi:hypothetical protein